MARNRTSATWRFSGAKQTNQVTATRDAKFLELDSQLQEERVPEQVVESKSRVEALPPEVELDALQQQVNDEPEPPEKEAAMM